jgi:hypothetical protein
MIGENEIWLPFLGDYRTFWVSANIGDGASLNLLFNLFLSARDSA